VISGVAQSGYIAGTKIAAPIVIEVTDFSGLPVPGVQLSLNTTGGGWITPSIGATDGEGRAVIYWTLGREAGPNSLQISIPNFAVSPVEFTTTTIPGAIALLFIRPAAATIAQGDKLQLVATPVDANGNAVGGAAISWVSSNETAVSVSSSGLLTAVAPGNAVIGATAGGASAYTIVAVPVPAGPNGPGIPPFTMAVSASQDYGISVVRSDGTVESKISCGSQCSFLAGPKWSRDGSKLAAIGRRDTLSVLFVVNRDGTGLHEVASAPLLLFTLGHSNSGSWPEFDEDWSTDGRLVYVRSTRAGSSIETVAADGTGRTIVRLATDSIRTYSDLFNVQYPRWGLGDSMISAKIVNRIYAMNPDGSNSRPLTPVGIGMSEHIWSPDGKTIAFLGDDPNQRAISVLDPVSGSLRQIVVPGALLCWAPNSSGFSLLTGDARNPYWVSISTVNLDGTGLQTAVIGMMTWNNPVIGAWSPDGRFLVYLDNRSLAGGPAGAQVYAQSLFQGTNTRLGDARNVIFFSIAETRGCGGSVAYP
jgi:Tol biopolymer transport system component